jgi:hypothetical protein
LEVALLGSNKLGRIWWSVKKQSEADAAAGCETLKLPQQQQQQRLQKDGALHV